MKNSADNPTYLTQLIPVFVSSHVPAVLHWVSLKYHWNVFNLNTTFTSHSHRGTDIEWQSLYSSNPSKQIFSLKSIQFSFFWHHIEPDTPFRFLKFPLNSVEILTLKEKLYFQFIKFCAGCLEKIGVSVSHNQTYFLFFNPPRNERHFPWLLTSSLACPAIRSLNMFSLATFVSLVLFRASS